MTDADLEAGLKAEFDRIERKRMAREKEQLKRNRLGFWRYWKGRLW